MPNPARRLYVSSLHVGSECVCREAQLTKGRTEDFGRPRRNGGGRAKRYGGLGRGQDVGVREADKTQRETGHRKRMYARLEAKPHGRSKESTGAHPCILKDSQS
jgi:hypothetical protein